jgi:hypothetical protein
MEACAGAHYMARKLATLGHNVKLMSPQFVRPFVKDPNPSPYNAIAVDRPTFVCRHCGAPMLVIDILTRTVPIRGPPKAARR